MKNMGGTAGLEPCDLSTRFYRPCGIFFVEPRSCLLSYVPLLCM